MLLKTLQWNIGGGYRRDKNADPLSDDSYKTNDLSYFSSEIGKYKPDICFLQEVHCNSDINQAKIVTQELGLTHYIDGYYANSHIENNQKLGLAIVSRFPVISNSFTLFFNPKFHRTLPNGDLDYSHDKGVLSAVLEIGGDKLQVKTLHMLPFRTWGVTDMQSEIVKNICADVEKKISPNTNKFLLEGDFNLDVVYLKPFFTNLIDSTVVEVPQEIGTTPKDRHYEHILYKGLHVKSVKVDSTVLTDHYLIVAEFAFN